MAETLVPGRKGQLYVAAEASYGTPPALAATDALRHLDFRSSFNPLARVNSPAKKISPGVVARFDRRGSAGATLEALLYPSGTLNTLAEASDLLEHGMGSKSNITLSTTVEAAPAPTTTGCTVASAVGLAKHQAILLVVSGVKYVRFLTDVSGAALTWAPALPGAPAAASAVKGCCTYRLASALAQSLCLAHYPSTDTTLSRIVKGAVVERLALAFAQNEEPRLSVTFKAKTQTVAPAKPAGFTTVGSQNPPSGLTGELYVGSATYKHIKSDLEIQTGVMLRENSYGFSSPEEILMTGRRIVTLGIDALVADEAVIYDNAEAGTRLAVMQQTGFTEGNIIAWYAPQVDFEVPSQDDSDEIPTWPFKGVCCESADEQNDEIMIALC